MKECVICGKGFQPRRSPDKTCSLECSQEHRRRLNREKARRHYKPRPPRPDIICESCGLSTPAPKSGVRKWCEKCRANREDVRIRERQIGANRSCYKCGVHVLEAIGKPGRTICGNCRVDNRNPELAAAKERRRVLRKYGLTETEYEAMLLAQSERCAICQTEDPGPKGTWSIDHDHDTMKVRGLLCLHCNTALGYAKDDPQLLRSMADYVEAHQEIKI